MSHPDHTGDGAGLEASPEGALGSNTPPWVDYLDGAGRWVGHDGEPPPDAVFIRRWAVLPLPADPERTLVLQVLVTTVRDDRARRMEWSRRAGVDALLVSVRSRKGQ